ncbi:hypothetical protein GTY65_29225 [Streptomyces sp. SID8379]|uniref:hypothetical protein n=1 Tax=unclassified Streptomyces TaxID=2593676 RepID=UPI0003713BCA|nr:MULTISPECIES: hypothetical protein [unclassified Streptomyces]MYW68126.1 hypothetical protein [Streptomyces sp. SID8379]
MKVRYLLLCGAAVVVALVLVFALDVPAETVLLAGGGALCLLWLVLLLTVPWNLYFRARSVVHEAADSREKGIAVPGDRDAEAARIATVMLRTAIGSHVFTAAVAVAVAVATGRSAGYWLAGCYLLSTFFRPAGAYFGALRRRLVALGREVRYPRDDIASVHKEVADLKKGNQALEHMAEEAYSSLARLHEALDVVGISANQRADRTDQRVDAMSREFESVVNRLTDNQEIITGLKAFLRLLRADGGAEQIV